MFKHQLNKDVLFFITALLVLLISSFFSTTIALIITSVFFLYYSYRNPKQSILFLVLYVSIRPLLIEVNTGLKGIGDLITFVALGKLFIQSIRDWKSLFQFKLFEWFFIAFLLFGAVIGYFTGVSPASIIFQIRTFVIMYLLYYILSRTHIPDDWYKKLAWVTVWTSLLVSVHGIIEKLSMRRFLLPDEWKYKTLSATNFVRIYGLPGNPNSTALLLMFGILGVLFLMHLYKNQKYKVFLNINLVLFLGVFVLTYSRGTAITAIVFGVIFLFLSRDWKILKRMALALVAAIVLVYYPVNLGVSLFQSWGLEAPEGGSGSITGRIGETFDEDNLALMAQSGRIFYIEKGFEVFMDHPITGTGFGTFGGSATLSYGSPIYDEYGIRSDIYGGKYFYSDNQYIQIIAETGIIGVILFAGFLLAMLALFWKERHTVFGKFMIALWFATGISGFYYNIWELKLYTMFYFILFGCFASRATFYKKTDI